MIRPAAYDIARDRPETALDVLGQRFLELPIIGQALTLLAYQDRVVLCGALLYDWRAIDSFLWTEGSGSSEPYTNPACHSDRSPARPVFLLWRQPDDGTAGARTSFPRHYGDERPPC